MKFSSPKLALASSFLLLGNTATAVSVLFHDFQNGTAGNLNDTGDLGTPAAGTVSAGGGFVSTTNPAYTSGANGASNSITVNANGTFNDVGTAAGNFLTATLSQPASISSELGVGETTTIGFSIAAFGTSNQNAFKLFHAVGYDTSGLEVFHITYRAGSGSGTREAWAREFGQDNSTFSGGSLDSIEGTKVVDNIAFGLNGTNTDARPSIMNVSVTIDNAGWGATMVPGGGSSTQTPVTGLGIASGASNLASIEFFNSNASSVNNQNNGFWLDNIAVDTDALAVVPEPSSFALLALAGLGVLRRRR